jgi:O-antigen/teichoic acid export membrane protein
LIKKIFDKLFSGHQRSVKAKKNILGSFGLKSISILISLILIPLTIDYLSPEKYGVWIALTSVIGWFNFFDFGLGNGLRNKLATAKAEGKDELGRVYISTTYAIVSIISFILFIVFFIVNQFLNWNKILNTTIDIIELEQLVLIVFNVFCLQFIVKLINVVFVADQRPAMSSAINTAGNLLSLIVVFVLINTTEGSLLYLGASFSIVNLLVPFVAGIWFFNTSYKKYRPSLKHVEFSHLKELMGLGARFFLMQAAALIVFMTDNMIIIQISGPEDVTSYNVAYKYFGIITIVFTIVTSSLWSAYTEAYIKKDVNWIKNSIKKVTLLWFVFVVIAIGMLLVCDYVYRFWVGPDVYVPFSLSLVMTVYVVAVTSIMVFGNFLSGVGKIRLSIYHSVIVGVINIPLSIFFAKNLELGSTGVILATCCGVFLSMLFQPVQCWKIINGTARGVWNK